MVDDVKARAGVPLRTMVDAVNKVYRVVARRPPILMGG